MIGLGLFLGVSSPPKSGTGRGIPSDFRNLEKSPLSKHFRKLSLVEKYKLFTELNKTSKRIFRLFFNNFFWLKKKQRNVETPWKFHIFEKKRMGAHPFEKEDGLQVRTKWWNSQSWKDMLEKTLLKPSIWHFFLASCVLTFNENSKGQIRQNKGVYERFSQIFRSKFRKFQKAWNFCLA